MADFDLIVIGTGAAGEKGAAQAAYFGKRVAVIEKRPKVGGARINSCALPAKALRETSVYLAGARNRRVKLKAMSNSPMADLMCKNEPLVDTEISRVEDNFERHGIRLIYGQAHFLDEHSIEVSLLNGETKVYTADVFLIATGSSPLHPSNIPFDEEHIVDSTSILRISGLPESMVVVGGGTIGTEFASMFAPLGVKVTLLNTRERLLTFADPEISSRLASGLTRLGIDIKQNMRAEKIELKDGMVRTSLSNGKALLTSHALICAGRGGNTTRLNLDALNIKTDASFRIHVNEHYQTDIPHIYAAGDVIGFPALASTGMEQARVAMCHAFDLKYKSRVSPILPLGIYTIPEFSMVGETEATAAKKGIDFEVGRAFYEDNARGLMTGDLDGMLKLIFEADSRKLIGAHIIGERATELIHIASLSMQFGGQIDSFIDAVFNYPTLSDLYKYAAYDGLAKLQSRCPTDKQQINDKLSLLV